MSNRCLPTLALVFSVAIGCVVGCGGHDDALIVFCAAGMKQPVEEIAEAYRTATGREVQLQFGGTGTLMSQIETSRIGDLFIAADEDSAAIVRERGGSSEVIPFARQFPVIAVAPGNPLGITSLDDLFRDDVRVAIGNPEAASIGKATRAAFGDRWTTFLDHVTVTKPTVTEIAMDVRIGSVDAAIVWNTTAPQFEGIEAVRVADLEPHDESVSISILTATTRPDEARSFVAYLIAPESGGPIFARWGVDVVGAGRAAASGRSGE